MYYLLDTNVIIFWLKNRHGISDKIRSVGIHNCFISEITIAELKFGVACSGLPMLQEKQNRLNTYLQHLQILPISSAIDLFATEKARLRQIGEIIPDFDILIGCTAVAQNLILVTNNSKHLSKISGLTIVDWVSR